MKKSMLFILAIVLYSCQNSQEQQAGDMAEDMQEITAQAEEANRESFLNALNIHLKSVSEKNLEGLKQTLSPDGKMTLILPQTSPTYTAEAFLDMHEAWFKDTTWTFETEILDDEISDNLGIGIVDIMYKEPDRNGQPYFNHMIVSYGLKKIDDQWYVIKDHACSIEKTAL